TSFSDTGLTANTLYYYRVRATNSGGDSANSNAASAMTMAALPAAPATLAATAASASQINLTWADGSNNETGFKVERSLNNSTWALVMTVGANVTAFSDTGLTASTLYYYRVRATNSGGDSASSNTASATTPAGAAPSVHIGDIDYTKTVKGSSWNTTVTVLVHNVSHVKVTGATVAATWSNGTTTTCTTGTKGTCAMSLTGLSSTTASVSFSVTNVTLSGSVYAPGSNHDPDTGTAASNGTSVTITKP
ncbi:MAG: fibronectin type III domain-containing protein, partial [Acidobacteria bacterium]|nr:fibronectin type III domain-containing protein [Acidobacteriota bacterium]